MTDKTLIKMYLEGASVDSIAQKADISTASVYNRVKRLREMGDLEFALIYGRLDGDIQAVAKETGYGPKYVYKRAIDLSLLAPQRRGRPMGKSIKPVVNESVFVKLRKLVRI